MCTFSIILALLVTLLVLGAALLLLGIKIDALEDSPNYSPKSVRPYRACSYIIKFGMILTACGLIGFLGSASGVLAAMAFAIPKPTRVPSGSWFDHSHNVATTIPFGAIVPIDWRFMMPGEKFKQNCSGFCRALMLKAPAMQDIDLKFGTFFVPVRLLSDNAEELIAACKSTEVPSSATNPAIGTDTIGIIRMPETDATNCFPYFASDTALLTKIALAATSFALPANHESNPYGFDFDSWRTRLQTPTASSSENEAKLNAIILSQWHIGSLSDYLGYPVMSDDEMDKICKFYKKNTSTVKSSRVTIKSKPISLLPYKAYHSICNHFFVPDFLRREAEHSKGILTDIHSEKYGYYTFDDVLSSGLLNIRYSQYESDPYTCAKTAGRISRINDSSSVAAGATSSLELNANTIRGMFALDEFARKAEYFFNDLRKEIKYMFGVKVSDRSAMSPILVDSGSCPIGISEIQNTSLDPVNDPQSSQSLGKMVASFGKRYDTFEVEEHGVMMTCVWVRPRASYMNRLNPMFRKFVDYASIPNPLFAEIGDSAYSSYDVDFNPFGWLASDSATKGVNSIVDRSGDLFGYNTRYVDWKYTTDVVSGDFRGSMKYWTCAREFDEDRVYPDGSAYPDSYMSAGIQFNLINGRYEEFSQPLNRIFTQVSDVPNLRPFQLQMRFNTSIWQLYPHIADEM